MTGAGDWMRNNPDSLAQLAGIGGGLLAASGPSREPTSFGQALGQGLLGGMQARGQSARNRYMDMHSRMLQAQTDQMLNPQSVPAKPEGWGHSLVTGVGPDGKPIFLQAGDQGTVRPVQGFAPPADAASAAAKNPMNIGGGLLYDPTSGKTIDVPGAFQRELQLRAAGGTRVQTNVSPTSIYEHTEGKAMSEMFGPLGSTIAGQQKAAQDTADTSRNIGMLNKELEGVPTGTGAELRLKGLKAMDAAGLTGPEQKGEIAKMESAHRIGGTMVLDQLNQLKGNATERERDYIDSVTPGLATTPQGRAAMQSVAQHQAERTRAKADAAAGIANEVQQNLLPIGDAQKKVRDLNSQIDSEFDKRFKPPAIGAPAKTLQTAPAAPSSAGRKFKFNPATGQIE